MQFAANWLTHRGTLFSLTPSDFFDFKKKIFYVNCINIWASCWHFGKCWGLLICLVHNRKSIRAYSLKFDRFVCLHLLFSFFLKNTTTGKKINCLQFQFGSLTTWQLVYTSVSLSALRVSGFFFSHFLTLRFFSPILFIWLSSFPLSWISHCFGLKLVHCTRQRTATHLLQHYCTVHSVHVSVGQVWNYTVARSGKGGPLPWSWCPFINNVPIDILIFLWQCPSLGKTGLAWYKNEIPGLLVDTEISILC